MVASSVATIGYHDKPRTQGPEVKPYGDGNFAKGWFSTLVTVGILFIYYWGQVESQLLMTNGVPSIPLMN